MFWFRLFALDYLSPLCCRLILHHYLRLKARAGGDRCLLECMRLKTEGKCSVLLTTSRSHNQLPLVGYVIVSLLTSTCVILVWRVHLLCASQSSYLCGRCSVDTYV